MLITHGVGDLLDGQIAAPQELGGPLQLLFDEKAAKAKTGLPLEQMLKMRFAQAEFDGQAVDVARPSGLNYVEYLSDTFLPPLVRR
jgi:hypothetical protein